ncbi:D-alanyl-D-alanine carboxypeptidase family protein [Microbacterium sp. P04]|uniref:D-alanyl-D-alanine carboxypeptidase family protein n=1 Tax=Microbacterium sp. P04 TaxID=3366947 RepID=UPI003744B621
MTTKDQGASGLSGLDELMYEPDGAGDEPRDPGRRRSGRRIGLIVTAVVLVIVLGVPAAYVGWAVTAPLAPPVATSQAPDFTPATAAAITLSPEGSSALSVVGGAAYLGPDGLSATSGSDEARPIASISKLITALVVLDAKPLAGPDDPGPTITFDKADHDLYDQYYVQGATVAAMPTGSFMTERDALATMLIPSASNYADAVSTWAFGSPGAFVSAARRWLTAQGLTATTIVEPTGISRRNTSTPADVMTIGKLAAANPTIAKLAATPTLSLPIFGTLSNTNDLLGRSGVTGLKTGNLGEGSYNLLYTATVDVGIGEPLSVTGVILGGSSRQSVDATVLAQLESIRAGFHSVSLAAAGQVVGSYSTAWGASAELVVADSASILTWSDTAITMTMDVSDPADYRDGEVVGSITWTAGSQTATAPLEVRGSIEQPTQWWRLTHPGELGG